MLETHSLLSLCLIKQAELQQHSFRTEMEPALNRFKNIFSEKYGLLDFNAL
jgi:hypothetical protein